MDNTIVIHGIVRGIGMWKEKMKLDIAVREWHGLSDYDTNFYNVSADHYSVMPVGGKYKIEARGKIKEGKSGSKPWDYFWNIVSVVACDDATYNAAPELDENGFLASIEGKTFGTPTPTSTGNGASGGNPRQIARAVALKAAIEFLYIESEGLDVMLAKAEKLEGWLMR